MDGKYGGSYEMPSFRINTMEMELFNLIATARGRGALKTEKFLEEMCAGYDFALSLSFSICKCYSVVARPIKSRMQLQSDYKQIQLNKIGLVNGIDAFTKCETTVNAVILLCMRLRVYKITN